MIIKKFLHNAVSLMHITYGILWILWKVVVQELLFYCFVLQPKLLFNSKILQVLSIRLTKTIHKRDVYSYVIDTNLYVFIDKVSTRYNLIQNIQQQALPINSSIPTLSEVYSIQQYVSVTCGRYLVLFSYSDFHINEVG